MYERILVGTDGSDTATRAVDRAVEVAAATGATLTVLSAGKPDRARQVVEAEQARLADTGVKLETRIAEGDAADALVSVAESGGFDLLVVGNKGMTGAGRFLGSVPNKVSHHASCALLIVRTT